MTQRKTAATAGTDQASANYEGNKERKQLCYSHVSCSELACSYFHTVLQRVEGMHGYADISLCRQYN